MQDPSYQRPAANTFAQLLLERNKETLERGRRARRELETENNISVIQPQVVTNGTKNGHATTAELDDDNSNILAVNSEDTPFELTSGAEDAIGGDFLADIRAVAVRALQQNHEIIAGLNSVEGVNWWNVQKVILTAITGMVSDPRQTAYQVLPTVLDELYGLPRRWKTNTNPKDSKRYISVASTRAEAE